MSDAETAGDEGPGLDLGTTPAQSAGAASSPYRVLARKYRPATFDDLIGQDAMVRTLGNAFEAGRIPQAWVLTGVRGVGKTTTARILARALNYQLPGAAAAPSIRMPSLGVHCQSIMESRHIDVIEMDAASHNGVDDVRQINDAVRYAPLQASYKVYILDEVHMLSGAAFNALLKTLEEPPPHVKFVFATTEIRKVPVTVLSRCQRFDLRRVEAGTLSRHLAAICRKEDVEAEADALALITRAAEGSVRDALSLLDQAIAHAAGPVTAAHVRAMLGLADRARVIDLFEALMRGDLPGALAELRAQYEAGADPAVALTDLADFTHLVTRIKVVPAVAENLGLAEAERRRGFEFAGGLSMRVLSRTWQMLLKGIAEVQTAPKPLASAEMVLVRIAYAADLPSPEDVIRALEGGRTLPAPGPARDASPTSTTTPRPPAPVAVVPPPPASRPPLDPRRGGGPQAALARPAAAAPSPVPPPPEAEAREPVRVLSRFEDVIALAGEKRDLGTKTALERDVRLVRMEDGKLEVALEPGASRALANELSRKLSEWTGRRWMVVVSAEAGGPTFREHARARREELRDGIETDPLVQAVLARFPGAAIVGVQPREDPPLGEAPGADDAAPLSDEADDSDLAI